MNILFATSAAPEKSPFSTQEKRPPLGLGSLMVLSEGLGHQVHFVDNFLSPTGFPDNGYLERHRIDVVAIYANTVCYRDTLRMVCELEDLRRRSSWSGKILLGGPHTSAAPQTIPDEVDHVVQGEGEEALADILEGRERTRWVRGRQVANLDALPFQPWAVFSALPYDKTCPWMDSYPVFTLNTSRGCPYNCSFCSVSSVWGRRYAYQSAERIVAEMEFLIKDFGARGFYFREDHFTLNSHRTEAFCRLLLRKGIQIPWACETRVDSLSEDAVKMMARSGCRALYLGIESGSQRVLDMLKKGITIKQIEDSIRWSKKHGINTYASLIVGVPGETFDDYLETEHLMRRLRPHDYHFNVFVGLPTSPLYELVLTDHAYEHMDDLGLLYLPGFHIKCEFFYGINSRQLVDHAFHGMTEFDSQLLRHTPPHRWKRLYGRLTARLPPRARNTFAPAKRRIVTLARQCRLSRGDVRHG